MFDGINLPVAVIIPVYNGRKYLSETIKSVLNQTSPPAEVLVIDDGSIDGSAEEAQSFGSAVRVIRRQNSGVSASRNYGASLTTAKWLAFMDADDIWEPENLERQAAMITASPDADVCYTGRKLFVPSPESGLYIDAAADPMPGPEELSSVLLDRCPFTPSAVTIRRETFLAVGGFNSAFDSVEDWDLWLRLMYHGARFVHCPEPLMKWRVHPESASNNAVSVLRTQLAVVRNTIFPHLGPLRSFTAGRRLESRLEAEAAILIREQRKPGSLELMLRSLLKHPFHTPRRYKIAIHMLLRGV
jgi:glycosyltransferase involved in cell wall biosynthesis